MQGLTIYAPFLGIFGLIIAWLIYLYVKKQPNGTDVMKELEGMIHDGAMAFLKREYSILVLFIAAVFILLGLILGEWRTSVAFITGAFCSMLAGYSGMTAATRGNSRTADAANQSGQAKAHSSDIVERLISAAISASTLSTRSDPEISSGGEISAPPARNLVMALSISASRAASASGVRWSSCRRT